jgi:hypothetical protein
VYVEFGSPTVTVTVTGCTPVYVAIVPVRLDNWLTVGSVVSVSVQSGPSLLQVLLSSPFSSLLFRPWVVYGSGGATSGMATALAFGGRSATSAIVASGERF